MVTWMYTTVKTHQIEHLRSVHFIVCCLKIKENTQLQISQTVQPALCRTLDFSILLVSFSFLLCLLISEFLPTSQPLACHPCNLPESFHLHCVGPNSHISVTKVFTLEHSRNPMLAFWDVFIAHTPPRFDLTITSKIKHTACVTLLTTSCLWYILFESHNIFLFEPTGIFRHFHRKIQTYLNHLVNPAIINWC